MSVFSNPIDLSVGALALLEQESSIARHAKTCGVPVPTIHALCPGNDSAPHMLVSDYIETDDAETEPEPATLGRLVRLVHDCPLPELVPLSLTGTTVGETIAVRLHRRAAVLDVRMGMKLDLPGPAMMTNLLEAVSEPSCLLHLDMRGPNLLGRAGRVEAVIDWSNMLIGPPGLELARIAEYGYAAPAHTLSESFLAAYGNDPLARLPRSIQLLYRLDTAVMLALLFGLVLPDLRRAASQLDRSQELARILRAEWSPSS